MTSSTDENKEFNAHEWVDPFPKIHGVLLSDYIKKYVDKISLIEEYVDSSLKPASYGLRLGGPCYNGDKKPYLRRFTVTEKKKRLVIPPNSIVFVSTIETLNMPRYLIGRFNVKIDLVYEGLLLGTGPQVDPGFKGKLSCPLHNISKEPIVLKHGQRFATIDFIKTTPFGKDVNGNTHPHLLEQAGEIERWGPPENNTLLLNGNVYKLFPRDKLERQVLYDYLPKGKRVSSSVARLRKIVYQVRRGLRFHRYAGVTLLMTLFVGGYFGLLSISESYREDYRDAMQRVEEISARLTKAEIELARLTNSTHMEMSKSRESSSGIGVQKESKSKENEGIHQKPVTVTKQ